MEKHISQFNCIYFAAISTFMALIQISRNLNYLTIFVLGLVCRDWVQSQQNSGAEQSEAVMCDLKFGNQFQGERG